MKPNKGKFQDPAGLFAEYLVYRASALIGTLADLLTAVLKAGYIPPADESTPVWKKGKPQLDLGSYREITVHQ
jgi:hypothetical protein